MTYSAEQLSDLTYQVEAESGDWIVVDKYSLSDGVARLERANLLAQQNLQIIQETLVRPGAVRQLRVVRATTLDGRAAVLPENLDLPEVPIYGDPFAAPAVALAGEMRSGSLDVVCRQLDGG